MQDIKGLQHSSPNTAGDPEPLFKTISTSSKFIETPVEFESPN